MAWKVMEISAGSGKFLKFDVVTLESSWICSVSKSSKLHYALFVLS